MKAVTDYLNKKKINIMDIMIYALFIAVFKSYLGPKILQQGLKFLGLGLVALYLWTNVEKKKLLNGVLPMAVMIVISTVYGFLCGNIGLSSIVHGGFHGMCIYLIYTLVKHCIDSGYQKGMMDAVYRVTSVFCVLSFASMVIQGHSPDGSSVTYLFGYKFMTSYMFMMWLGLFRMKYREKIDQDKKFKGLYIAFILILIGICSWLYCSTTMLAAFIFLIEVFLPKKVKQFLMKPYVFIGIVVIAGILPFIIKPILELSFVQFFITEILHKSITLTGRIKIFESIAPAIGMHPILGHGYGNVIIQTLVGYGNAQNALMQFTIDYGLIGFGLFMIILFRCVKKNNIPEELEGLYILLYALIFCSMVEISYNYIWYVVLFIVGCWKTSPKGE